MCDRLSPRPRQPSKISAMKRGSGRLLLAAALMSTLAGCETGTGDRNLANDPSAGASSAAAMPASVVGQAASMKRAYQLNPTQLEQTPCTQSHVVETYHVGQFPAEVTQPPQPGEPAYVRAFEGCESAAKDLLGGEWYGGRL